MDDFTCRAAIGKHGATADKVEGDGKTPIGQFHLGPIYYRADKIQLPPNITGAIKIEPHFGWCDDPAHPDYNKFISLPHPARHENLWRDDDKYDIVVVMDYNMKNTIAGRGSAIFLHIAKPDYSGTEGCVAISLSDMMRVLPHITDGVTIDIA